MSHGLADDNCDHALDHLSEERFIQAMELPLEERESFLSQQDPEVAEKVRSLLAEFNQFDQMVEDQAASIKEVAPSLASLATQDAVFSQERTLPEEGQRVGPYTILRKVGQGGMGTVFLARQENPTREVALKIIPKKQVSKHFLARFESEYQALALMSHHHIARLYDAGATPDGNAYFCMEYIDGVSITEFCREHPLSVQEKLQLFLQVCSGMQHAHQKAIVHRDLKPSNILVCMIDGQPTAKIIDFGLAKGLANPLSEKTLHTHAGALAGTPAYMSPEQLMGNQEQVDTRGDIYALGVILYEILAGRHPFDLEGLGKKPLDEALRTLRLEEPKPPSFHLKKVGGTALPTDLDHITRKAMGKQLLHRYPSVDAFREDLDHFLNFRPVSARSRSNFDVFAKFVRRNRILFAAFGMTLAALIIGLALSITSSIKANRAKEEAETTLNFLMEMLEAPNPSVSGRDVKVVDLLAEAEARLRRDKEREEFPELETALRRVLGNTYFGLGIYEDASMHLRRALALHQQRLGEDHEETLRTNFYLARNLRRAGSVEEATQRFEKTLEAQRIQLGADHPHALETQAGLAMTLRLTGRIEEAESLFRNALNHQRRILGTDHRQTLISLVGLGNCNFQLGKLDEAASNYQEALSVQERTLGPEAPQTLASRHALANCLIANQDYHTAETLLRKTIALREKVLGVRHSETNRSRYSLGRALSAQNRYEDAAEILQVALADSHEILGKSHYYTLRVANRLVSCWRRMDRTEEAGDLAESLVPAQFAPDTRVTRDMLRLLQNLADIRLTQERYYEAISLFQRFLEQDPRENMNRVSVHNALAICYQETGLEIQAEQHYCLGMELGRALDPEDERTQTIEQYYDEFRLEMAQ